jgi:hypothetical protein
MTALFCRYREESIAVSCSCQEEPPRIRGSRFDEAGVSTNYVSKILGHASLSTTIRYLNIQRRGLHLAMEKLEESQKLEAEERKKKAEKRQQHGVAHPLPAAEESAPAFVLDQRTSPARKQLPS